MTLLHGKKGLIMGVANERSIAWGISKKLSEAGADLAFTYVGDALKKRVIPLAQSLGSKITLDCNVEEEKQIEDTFSNIKKNWGPQGHRIPGGAPMRKVSAPLGSQSYSALRFGRLWVSTPYCA